MRVPPHFLRFVLALAIFGLAFAALLTAETASQPAPTPTGVPVAAPPTPPPPPSPTARPTQTPRPITSIIVRETLVPSPTATPFPSPLKSVDIVDFSFMPGTVRITAGQSVFWRNAGTEQHDVTGSDWHSGPLDPNYTYRLTFGLPGTYAYRCSIHLDMVGSVVVS